MSINHLTIIAVVGASASGKSLFAKTIYNELIGELGQDSMTIINEDSYYKCQDHLPFEERIKTNYDHPSAFEHDLLKQHLTQLSQGQMIHVPVYDYKRHTRSKEEVIPVNPARVVLVEGIMLFTCPELRKRFDINIYMDTPLDICLLRRIKRDLQERGRDFSSVHDQYHLTVRPMYFQYIEPSRNYADIVITRGGRNRRALELIKAKIRELVKEN